MMFPDVSIRSVKPGSGKHYLPSTTGHGLPVIDLRDFCRFEYQHKLMCVEMALTPTLTLHLLMVHGSAMTFRARPMEEDDATGSLLTFVRLESSGDKTLLPSDPHGATFVEQLECGHTTALLSPAFGDKTACLLSVNFDVADTNVLSPIRGLRLYWHRDKRNIDNMGAVRADVDFHVPFRPLFETRTLCFSAIPRLISEYEVE